MALSTCNTAATRALKDRGREARTRGRFSVQVGSGVRVGIGVRGMGSFEC